MSIPKYFNINTIQVIEVLEYTYILKYLSIKVQRYTHLSMKVNLNTYYIIVFEYGQIHKAFEYT